MTSDVLSYNKLKIVRILFSPKERDNSEDRGIDWRKGSELMFGRLAGGYVEWIQLAEDGSR
jgi:hypothetical protein